MDGVTVYPMRFAGLLAGSTALLAACTTLGPMPMTTGISAVPGERSGGEVTAGIVPVFRLSDSASGKDRSGNTLPAAGALFDPGKWLGLPGLFVSARVWGKNGDTSLEPQLGYRTALDDRWSIGGVVYGTKMADDDNGASYKATRAGGEAMVDARLTDGTAWLTVHAQGSLAATYIKASGTYCYQASSGNGQDCAEDGSVPMVDGKLSGVFPAATLSLAVDVGHRPQGNFHSARLAAMFGGGWMPRIVNGDQRSGDPYLSGGLSLTVAFGTD